MNTPFTKWKFIYYAGFSILLFVISHIAFISLPPTGNHVWRQSNTLAIAKNFYNEDMNILHPRVDKRNMTSGITGTNFPFYEWVLANVYRITGFNHWVHRGYALFISIVSFLLTYLVFKERNEQTGRLAGWIFLFNPLVFYYGFSALPDMLAILFALVANVLIIHIVKTSKWYLYPLLLIAISIALMIKFTYALWLVIPFLIIDSKYIKPKIIPMACFSLLGLIPVIAWYHYADYLTQISGGLVEFVYYARIITSAVELKSLGLGLLSSVPELLFGFPSLVLFFVTLRYAKTYSIHIHWFYKVGTGILCVGYFIAASYNLINHDYYLLPFLGIILLQLSTELHRFKIVVPILLFLMPVWAFLRIVPTNWIGESPEKFAIEHKKIKQVVSPTDRVICGADQTGSYLFYMLNVKGFPYEKSGDLLKDKKGVIYLEDVLNAGASYLITNNEADLNEPLLTPFYNHRTQVGERLWLIKLTAPQALRIK